MEFLYYRQVGEYTYVLPGEGVKKKETTEPFRLVVKEESSLVTFLTLSVQGRLVGPEMDEVYFLCGHLEV